MAGVDGAVQDFFSSTSSADAAAPAPADADAGGDGEQRNAVPPTPLYFGDLLGQIQHKREPCSSSMADAGAAAERADPSLGCGRVKEEGSQGSGGRSSEGACKIELNGSEAWRLHGEEEEHGTAILVGKNEEEEEEEEGGAVGMVVVEDKESAQHSSRQGNWLVSEILILLEGKAKEEEAAARKQQQQPRLSADDKWKNVSEYCRSRAVNRSKEQCRVKWDNMMPDFRKIRDHEEQLLRQGGGGGGGNKNKSYFDMDAWERRAHVLPSNMDMEVYLRIAAILSNKPPSSKGGGGGGGLKREAREKRSFCPSSPTTAGAADFAESLDDQDHDPDRPPLLADLVGKHVAASAPRKRRRRRASCDAPPPPLILSAAAAAAAAMPTSSNSDCMTTMMHLDMTAAAAIRPPPPDPLPHPESQNDSSTEDDDAPPAAAAAAAMPPAPLPPPSSQCLFAERSSLPCQKSNGSNDASPHRIQRFLFDAKHPEAVFATTPHSNGILPNNHQHAAPAENPMHARHGGGSEEAAAAAGVMGHSEERKEARHREMMALEREKLAVFKEATYAMASAMTNAMAVFSKMADELLMMRRRRRT